MPPECFDSCNRPFKASSVLLSISAYWNTCRYDSARAGRIHADCDAHRHARFKIDNSRSLPVYIDFRELCNDKCSRRFFFAYSDRVARHARNDRRMIRWCRLLFLTPAESGSGCNHCNYCADRDQRREKEFLHGLRFAAYRMRHHAAILPLSLYG